MVLLYMKEYLMKINLMYNCQAIMYLWLHILQHMSQFLSVQVCTLLSQSLHDLIFNKGIWPLARNLICIHTYKDLFNEQHSDIV